MPNPSGTCGGSKSYTPGPATYDILMVCTKTGRVRAILAEKMESSHSLATTKSWDAQAGTKECVITDSIHGKHKVGDVFKDFLKGFGYFDKKKAAEQQKLLAGGSVLWNDKGP